MSKLNSYKKLLKDTLPLTVFVIILLLLNKCGYLQSIITDINKHREYAPFIFIILLPIASNMFVPTSLLIISASVIFGSILGFIYSYIGGILSVFLGYFIFKRFIFVKDRHFNKNITELFEQINNRGCYSVLLIRLMAIPFTLQNILTSILKIPFRYYLINSFIGMTPWFVGFSFFGESLIKMKYHLFALSVLLLILLFILPSNILRLKK